VRAWELLSAILVPIGTVADGRRASEIAFNFADVAAGMRASAAAYARALDDGCLADPENQRRTS
jgi:hypothetical protein